MTTAGIYVRVSTARQEEEGTSLDTQEAACRAYAAEQGYTVNEAHVYRETFSGIELWERPQLSQLREAVRQKYVGVVVAYAIDRLAREPVHLGVLLTEADHAGVEVAFVTELLDNSPEGALIRYIRGYAAKVEHEKIKERTMRGKLERARSGKLMPASRPLYGYDWNAGRTAYVENPTTAPIVRRIFADAALGETLFSIAAKLTAEGIPSPKGHATWARTSVWVMLKNPAYGGYSAAFRYATKTRNATGERVKSTVLRPRDQHIALPEGTIPPLVEESTFNQVQSRLERNKIEASRRNRHPEMALLRAGYAKCGYCGSNMAVTNARRYPQYRCGRTFSRTGACSTHTINISVLDGVVWDRIAALLADPMTVATELERLRGNDPTTADLAAVERQLADVTRRRGNLIDRLADAEDADLASAVKEKLTVLSNTKHKLETKLERVLDRRRGWESATTRLADVQTLCSEIAARLHSLDYHTKRLALEALDVQVRVFRVDHEPRYIIEAVPFTVPALAPPSLPPAAARDGYELSEASHRSWRR